MLEPTSVDGLSPLDQIRRAEAEITRQVIAVREASEHSTANAHMQATLLKKHAEEQGKREGQIRYKETLARAEEQAQVMIAQSRREADALQRNGQARMDLAVNEALMIVLSLKESGDAHES